MPDNSLLWAKQEPAFTGIQAAYYTGGNGADYFNSYPPRVQPGDVILVHAGLYKDDRYRYGAPLGGIGGPLDNLVGDATKYVVRKAPCRVLLTAPPGADEAPSAAPEE